jgi:hypothetical protein
VWPRACRLDGGGAAQLTTSQEITVFQNQPETSVAHRVALRAAALVLTSAAVVALGAGSATARPDAGPALSQTGRTSQDDPSGGDAADRGCRLQRVETQYVRCDDNTGNGVPAPAWIPER